MVQVKVSEGILEGLKEKNPYGGEYYSFKGIPYAEPPLGDLRFKIAQPKRTWEGVRAAKECGPQAVHIDYMSLNPTQVGNEDCLYLNIYTPEVFPSRKLAVIVWIHGGGFNSGSGDERLFGPQFLIQKDVILVTLNYRLGVIGYLCLDTEDIPGNLGMKDQVAAFRWIKTNIGNFGGDSENITIMGGSSGSISVTYHMVSPMSKGLFKRVICLSGTALTPGVSDPHARKRGLDIARRLGCHSNNDKEIYEFFKSVPAEKFCTIAGPLTFLEANRLVTGIFLGPVIEKKFKNVEPFLTEDACDALKNRDDAPEILLGYVEHEGVTFIFKDHDLETVPERYNTFQELFVPKHLLPYSNIDLQFEIADRIKEFYFEKGEIVTRQNWFKLSNFLGFEMFGFAVLEWAKLCASKKENNVFLYKLTSKSERNKIRLLVKPEYWNIFGDQELVDHGDDIFYVFPIDKLVDNSQIDQHSLKCIDNVVTLFTNFAKNGNPTPDNSLGVKWKPYTCKEKNYLDIGNKLKSEINPNEEELVYWESLFKEFGGSTLKSRLQL